MNAKPHRTTMFCSFICSLALATGGRARATPVAFELGAGTYQSCSELQTLVKKQLQLKRKSDLAEKKYWGDYWNKHPGVAKDQIIEEAAQQASTTEPLDPNAITNVQEAGVDEEDFVKVTRSNIFVLRQNHLEVIDRPSLQSIGTVALQDDFPAEAFAHESFTSLKMYSDGDVLTIMGQIASTQAYPYEPFTAIYQPPPSLGQGQVKVLMFQTKAGALPEKIREETFSGNYLDSRLTAHHLYLIVKDTLPLVPGSLEGLVSDHPVVTVNGRVQGVPCQQLGKQKVSDLDFNLTKVISMDMQSQDLRKKPFITAMVGGGDQIYMSLNNVYITKQGFTWRPFQNPDKKPQTDAYESLSNALVVSKLALKPAQDLVSIEADGVVQGFAKNQFHFKEYPEQGVLALATTSYGGAIDTKQFAGQVIGEGINHLWILQQDGRSMKVINGLYQFGKPGEDLRSVRFSGDYVYLVTFKKTDPLFAINMKDPLSPVLEGELMIPGFSLYMHPISDHRLVGVGYEADDQGDFAWYQGVQVSLFDAADPKDLKRLDNKIHGQRGSYTDVTGNHHAFHYNAESGIFTLPIVELVGKKADRGPEYGAHLRFSGALAYRMEGDRLSLKGRISHRDLMPEACLPLLNEGQWWENRVSSLDVNRLIRLDGRWLSISRFGLKTHDPDHLFQPTKTVAFKRDFITCSAST